MSPIIRSPQHEIYDAIYNLSKNYMKYHTFDYLPPKEQALPFVAIGEQFTQDRQTKQSLYGDIQQTIHIYGSRKQRREVMKMGETLNTLIRGMKHTENFDVKVLGATGRAVFDDTTPILLVHYILEVDMRFHYNMKKKEL